MYDKYAYNVTHYFARHLKRPVKELYLTVAIMDLATAAVLIFEPIYLYTLGFSVQKILLFFLGTYLLYFLIMPLGAKYANARGYSRSIFISTLFLVVYYVCFFALAYFPSLIYLAGLMLACQKTFYWPGYHADFARFSEEHEQAREISTLRVINDLVYILGPLIGGLIITFFSFGTLFVIVILLILVSNLPLSLSQEKVQPKPFSYNQAYKRLFKKHHRRKLFAYVGFGEELVVMVIWPIFIFLIIKSFLMIGTVVALAALVTAVLTLYIGRVSDKHHKHPLIKLGSVLYTISWWLRFFAKSAGYIFLVDSLSRISKNLVYVPLTAITYFKARRYNLMQGVLFFEMALVLGKLIALAAVIFAIYFFGLNTGFVFAFLLAGLMSLLYNFLD